MSTRLAGSDHSVCLLDETSGCALWHASVVVGCVPVGACGIGNVNLTMSNSDIIYILYISH